jgi:F-type H+-transporting ATPase subunit gamma
MAKIHKIKRRMKSVGKIQQITKAMERVAASKMRRSQTATLRSRPYSSTAREILAQLFVLTDRQAHPLFAQREIKRRLFVVFSSDRGLAGAYNSTINRLLVQSIEHAQGDAAVPRVIVIGRKGAQVCAKLERAGSIEVIGAYTDWPVEPTTVTVQPIVDTVIREFADGVVDAAVIIFTDFVSGLLQVATSRQLLPIDAQAVLQPATASERLKEALFEPSPRALLDYMVPRLVGVQLYQASLEAAASEQSMRVVAMRNASDNASGLLEDLGLTYNSARQAAITQELAEISAGAEAMR